MFASRLSAFSGSLKEIHDLLILLHWQYRGKNPQEGELELAVGEHNILSEGVLEGIFKPGLIDFAQPYNFLHFLFGSDSSPLVKYPVVTEDLSVVSQVLDMQYVDEVEKFGDEVFQLDQMNQANSSQVFNDDADSAQSEVEDKHHEIKQEEKQGEQLGEELDGKLGEASEQAADWQYDAQLLCLDQVIKVINDFLDKLFLVLKNKNKIALLNALGQEYEGKSACVMLLENKHLQGLCPEFITQKFPELLKELLTDPIADLALATDVLDIKRNIMTGLSGHIGLLHLLCKQAELEVLARYIGTEAQPGIIPRNLLAQALPYQTIDHYTPIHFLVERRFDLEEQKALQAELVATLIHFFYFPMLSSGLCPINQKTKGDEESVESLAIHDSITSSTVYSQSLANAATVSSKSKKNKKGQVAQSVMLLPNAPDSEVKEEKNLKEEAIVVSHAKRAELFSIAIVKLNQCQHDILALAIAKSCNPLVVERLIAQIFQPMFQSTNNSEEGKLSASEIFLSYRDVKGYSYLALAACLGSSKILKDLIASINLIDSDALTALCSSQTSPALEASSSGQVAPLGVLTGAMHYGLSFVPTDYVMNATRSILPKAFVESYQSIQTWVESTGVVPVMKDAFEVGRNTLSSNAAALLPINIMNDMVSATPCLPFELGLVSCRREQLLVLADATPFHLLAIRGFCLDKAIISNGGLVPKFGIANGGLSFTYAALIKAGGKNTLTDIHDMLAPRVALFNLLHYFLSHYDGCEENSAEKNTALLAERESRVACVKALLASVVNGSVQHPVYPEDILKKSERFKHLYKQLELFSGAGFIEKKAMALAQFSQYLEQCAADPVLVRLQVGSSLHPDATESFKRYAQELIAEVKQVLPNCHASAVMTT